MPIYEYLCSSCGNKHEALQKISEDLLVDCPKCDEPSLVKMVTAAGFQLKCGGWYVTDFKDKKQPSSSKSPADVGGDTKVSGSSSDVGGDTKVSGSSSDVGGDTKVSGSSSDVKNTNETKSTKESSKGGGD